MRKPYYLRIQSLYMQQLTCSASLLDSLMRNERPEALVNQLSGTASQYLEASVTGIALQWSHLEALE